MSTKKYNMAQIAAWAKDNELKDFPTVGGAVELQNRIYHGIELFNKTYGSGNAWETELHRNIDPWFKRRINRIVPKKRKGLQPRFEQEEDRSH